MPTVGAAPLKTANSKENCRGNADQSRGRSVALPVVGSDGIRHSKSGRRRAIVLLIVHLLILAHILHWMWTGRTVSPIEPSEAKDLAMTGVINTGFIFFGLAILSTLVFGRFFCGWGCHVVAYQDATLWLLKKLHLRPKQFRSRLLIFVPLIAAVYMFFLPWIYRAWFGYPQPHVAVHLSTTGFWSTFPSYGVAILTILVCGVAIVYFLGPKGFCTYACPYGGVFGTVDQVAVGRIRVTDDCHQCGHCTAVCTSNVDVAREVNLYGMVVDPGCMKCLDCVSVCPNDALYVGFGRPGLIAATRTDANVGPARKYDLTWGGELLAALIFLASFLAFRGLYGKIPFLMSLGMAGITTFVVYKALSMLTMPDTILQKIRLKVNGQIMPAGFAFLAFAIVLIAFTVHSGYWQYHDYLGRAIFDDLPGEDFGWQHQPRYLEMLTAENRAAIEKSLNHLDKAQRAGLMHLDDGDLAMSWLQLLRGDRDTAVRSLKGVLDHNPEDIGLWLKLGTYEMFGGKTNEAKAAFERALALEQPQREALHRKLPDEPAPMSGLAWGEWGFFLASQNKVDEARAALLKACQYDPTSTVLWCALGQFDLANGRVDEARAELLRAIDVFPGYHPAQQTLESLAKAPQDFAAALRDYDEAIRKHPDVLVLQFNRAYALTELKRLDEAAAAYAAIIKVNPDVIPARMDLGTLLMMRGDLKGAIEQYERIVAKVPNDPESLMRMAFLYVQAGRKNDAEPLLRKVAQIGTPEQRAGALDALKQIGK